MNPSARRDQDFAPCHLVIVVGYGNDLRGDDAAGPRVAELVAALALPGVRALAVRQLTPELAEQLAGANLALFVDAYPIAAVAQGTMLAEQLRPVAPAPRSAALLHASGPCELLALALTLYGHAPAAWLIGVPALAFGLGAPLSPTAERGVLAAVQRVGELISGSPGNAPAR